MGIEDVPTAYRSPWQNGHVERVIGSIRRECLDHMIIFNENHLKRVPSGPAMASRNTECVSGTACAGGLGESGISPRGLQGENAMNKSV